MNNTFMLDRLARQRDDLENIIRNYQQPVITTPLQDLIEWRILKENEEVDNLYVNNKTLFVGDSMMVLKGVDGSLEKWEIKKIYPVDKKDEKINALEEEIKKLKEMIGNEHTESISTTSDSNKSNTNVDGDSNRKSKTSSKSISEQE